MIKMIKGHKCSTDTAKLVGTEHINPGDHFTEIRRTLYRTKSGWYFTYCEGGPYTEYSRSYGNNICGGVEWQLLNISQAMDWAELHLTGEEYITEFGDPEAEEDPSVEPEVPDDEYWIHTKLSSMSRKLLAAERTRSGKKIAEILNELICKNLEL